MNSEFVFRIEPIRDCAAAAPQLAAALERYTNRVSRKKYPHIWRITDKIRGMPRISPEQSARRKRINVILAVMCWVVGLSALLPGLMSPDELSHVLYVGIFAVVLSAVVLWVRQKLVFSGLSLLTGAFMLFVSLGMETGGTTFAAMGNILMSLAVAALIARRRKGKNRFMEAAEQVLDSRGAASDMELTVAFSDDCVVFCGKDAERTTIPYKTLMCIIVTRELLVVAGDKDVMVLQWCEITGGTVEEFLNFMALHVEIIR